MICPNRRISATTRAVLDNPERGFPRVELIPAVGTCRGAARIANSGCTGTRLELFAASTTVADGRVVRESTLLEQLRVGVPKGDFFDLVASGTKGHKIAQDIRVTVVAEQPKGADVMYWQPWLSNAAPLACIAIAVTSRFPLPNPVLASVADMSTEPSRVVLSAPCRGRTPASKTSTATEVLGPNRTRRFLNRVSASRTLHLNPVQPDAFSMDALPRSVTSKAAKRVLRHSRVIRLSLNSYPALNTSNSDHTELYHVWTVATGGHFA